MTGRYKVTGIDPGETGVRLGNCLTMRRSRDVVNTPGMYEKIRGSAMGWMNSTGSIDNLVFFDELFGSDVVLNHVVPAPGQRGDAMESAVLVAALLIAFPDARFGIGLSGGEDSLGGGLYRSLGKQAVALLDGSEARDFLIPLFEYLRNNSYWVDDDLVHMLALLSALCQDLIAAARYLSRCCPSPLRETTRSMPGCFTHANWLRLCWRCGTGNRCAPLSRAGMTLTHFN